MTTDGRPQTPPPPESREAAEKPPTAPPLYSEASVAEEVEEARKNDLARKGHTDDTKEHVHP
jgi:hypothetical protein